MSAEARRSDFPALAARPGSPSVAYLDSACMSLVPRSVLHAMEEYYRDYPGCAGRSLHRFAEEVSHRYEGARDRFARFLGAPERNGLVFVRNATEAINLVGQGIAWKRGDRVLVTDQEHNSNLVLWQRLATERGIRLEVLTLPDDGRFPSERYEELLSKGVRLVSVFHTSNLDGRSVPAREVVERAHDHGTMVLLDGCQTASHHPVDLSELGADFYAVSAHKMLGPTGVGVLAARPEALAELRPLLSGGETVEWTTLTSHELRPIPHRFEAGLQNYAGVLGAQAALDYLERAGLREVAPHDAALNRRLGRALEGSPRVHRIGPSEPVDRSSIFAFWLEGVDSNDAALFLDQADSVMVRSGRHCVHSWYDAHGLEGNLRASFHLYTNDSDVDRLAAGVAELLERIPAVGESRAKVGPPPRRAGGGTKGRGRPPR